MLAPDESIALTDTADKTSILIENLDSVVSRIAYKELIFVSGHACKEETLC